MQVPQFSCPEPGSSDVFLQEAVKQAQCVQSKTVGTHFVSAREVCVAVADDSGCKLQAASGHVA